VLEQKIDAATDHKELQRLVSELSMLKSGQVPEDRAYDIYLRYHGEIEARDAAARRTWDKDMRREVFPTDREDAIIRFGKKEAEEIERELLR
jgi:hypothetical protein